MNSYTEFYVYDREDPDNGVILKIEDYSDGTRASKIKRKDVACSFGFYPWSRYTKLNARIAKKKDYEKARARMPFIYTRGSAYLDPCLLDISPQTIAIHKIEINPPKMDG